MNIKIKELELEMAQTKLQLVEAESKLQAEEKPMHQELLTSKQKIGWILRAQRLKYLKDLCDWKKHSAAVSQC
ncbi:hypothetical protein scyTo_0003069 [Scyliorhinus torazame]|uniref:Uncharacterized protein n=1 Tax=Scyliorhinus torazame TaxID=75743 RepID=A0A401PLK0_SCYTO|nr:hypothetical protein [Scyliorhinus torazame]